MDGLTINFNQPALNDNAAISNRIVKLQSDKNAHGLRAIADLIVAAQKEAFENWEGKALWDNCKDLVDYARSEAKQIEAELKGDPAPPVRTKSKPLEHPYVALEKSSLLEVLENACCALHDCERSTADLEKLINYIKGIK